VGLKQVLHSAAQAKIPPPAPQKMKSSLKKQRKILTTHNGELNQYLHHQFEIHHHDLFAKNYLQEFGNATLVFSGNSFELCCFGNSFIRNFIGSREAWW